MQMLNIHTYIYIYIYIYLQKYQEYIYIYINLFAELSMYKFPKQSLAVGVLTVLLRGLVLSGVTAVLPGSIFYCNLQYLVTPTFKTPGKVNTIGELLQQTLIFTMKY